VICQSRLFSWILEENKKLDITIKYERLDKELGELGDSTFLTCILPEKSSANI